MLRYAAILTLIAILSCGVVVWAKPALFHPVLSEPSGEITWSETNGLLTATLPGGGLYQAHVRWNVPSVSEMPDLKSFDVCFGTSTGDYDILNEKQLDDELQPGANEILVKGLSSGTYYWKVRARDSEENVGGYCAEQTCTSETAWTEPGSPTSIGQANFPLTMSSGTHYQLSEDITVTSGNAISTANNCSLDFNGHTLNVATTGAGKGLVYGTGRSGVVLYDSTATTPGTGGGIVVHTKGSHGIHASSGALGTGNVVRDIFIELNVVDYDGTDTWGIEFEASSNDMRIFNVDFRVYGGDNPLTPSLVCGCVKDMNNTHVYGCNYDLAADKGRLYAHEDCDGPGYIWANTVSTTHGGDVTTFNGGWIVLRSAGGAYVHDNTISSNGDGYRVLFTDGQSGRNARYLWNTVTAQNPTSSPDWMGTVFDCRNDNAIITPAPEKNVAYGFNTVTLTGDSAPHAYRFDGVGWIGPPDTGTSWQTAYNYHNTANDIYLTRGGLETGNDHTGVTHWSNTYNRKTGFTGIAIGWGSDTNTTETAVEYFNNITINGSGSTDVSGPPTTATNVTWHVYSPWSSGDSSENSRITYEGAWTGYNPNTDSVPTPTGMSQVTGVH